MKPENQTEGETPAVEPTVAAPDAAAAATEPPTAAPEAEATAADTTAAEPPAAAPETEVAAADTTTADPPAADPEADPAETVDTGATIDVDKAKTVLAFIESHGKQPPFSVLEDLAEIGHLVLHDLRATEGHLRLEVAGITAHVAADFRAASNLGNAIRRALRKVA